jgi:hypothetical protein
MPVVPKEKDYDTLKMVLDRFYRAEAYAKSWHDNGEEWYKRYRFYKSPSKYPYKHNVKDRLTFTICEVITARVLQALFAVQPFLSIVPREGNDVRMAKQLERVVDVLIGNPDREFFLEFADFVKQAIIYGTSYLSVTPRFNTSNWEFDGLNFDCEDYFDVFPDPSCKRLSRAKFIIKRSIRYWDDLKELAKLGVYNKQAVDDIKSNTVADFDHKLKERLMSVGLATGVDYADPKTGEVEILDYFEDGHIVTVGARGVVLRDTKKDVGKRASASSFGEADKIESVLPYHLPLVDVRFIQVPREFFGIGAPEVLSDDQHYIDLIRSARLDNIDLVINKLFKVRINSDIDPDTIFSAPGNIIPVTNMDDIEEFKTNDIMGSAWQEEQSVKSSAEDAIGEPAQSRGLEPTIRSTATAVVTLKEASMTRFDTVLKTMEFTAVRSIGQKIAMIIHEYMTPQQYARIVNPKTPEEMGSIEQFFSLDKEELMRQIDVVPVGSSITSQRDVRSQQIMQAQGLLMQLQPQITMQNNPPFTVNMLEVAKMSLEDLDIRNVDEILQEQAPQPPAQEMGMPGSQQPEGTPPQPGMPSPDQMMGQQAQPPMGGVAG